MDIKGAGGPILEQDFLADSDMIGSILEGLKTAERMEFRVFSRLAVLDLI